MLCAALLWTLPAHAQDATASMQVTARVLQTISVVGAAPLQFGDIVSSPAGTTKEVDPGSPDAGRFEVTGSARERIQVAFTAPDVLTHTAGEGTLDVDLQLFGAEAAAAAPSAARLLSNEVVTLAEDGRYFFFVAGSLTARGEARNPPGDYAGEVELSVSYTSI